MTATRIHLLIGALFGALGVAALAAGSHVAGGQMSLAGEMLLFHAPALMAATLARKAGHLHRLLAQTGIAALAIGVALFSADMAMRGLSGDRLFAMAAPAGGMLTIGAWIILAISALAPGRPSAPQA
jgi:uncharacterized membrane protein YgdD (TMEM256/DUF423 family)